MLCGFRKDIEKRLGIKIDKVSGGNSSVWDLIEKDMLPGCINEVRIGEAILLGNETTRYRPIEGAYTDAFKLDAEIIEVKRKNGKPYRIILALGMQDINFKHIKCYNPYLKIIGSSSDHTVMRVARKAVFDDIRVGGVITFRPDYFGVLSLMTSPFVKKIFLDP